MWHPVSSAKPSADAQAAPETQEEQPNSPEEQKTVFVSSARSLPSVQASYLTAAEPDAHPSFSTTTRELLQV